MAECMNRAGQRLGNYSLIDLLGSGVFAKVYLAEHLYLNTRVAIKVLQAQPGDQSRQDFLTEARLLGRLVHPHIIRVFDFGLQDEVPYLVMDYAPHGNLRHLHPAGSRLPLSTVVAYVLAIASALQYAHDQRIIHRDLKPENLLLGAKHEVLLSDFGLALLTSTEDNLQVQARLGTLAYMAPEQIRGQPSAASDQYALAVMVYEWLCGRLPFQGSVAQLSQQHLDSAPPSLRDYLADLPAGVERVVLQALAKDPAQRFVDVLSFATAFEEACQVLSPLLAVSSKPATPEAPNPLLKREQFTFQSLPAPLTPLLGRAEEIHSVRKLLLHPGVRLLTLTGPPGVGKTRLAVQVAMEVQQAFSHGVCFILLAAIREPEVVMPTLAHTLGLSQSQEQRPVERLKVLLHDKQLLLLLDNFEQVLTAGPQLTELLSACPRLKLLVTSRSVLHVEGEYEFVLPQLALPDLRRLPTHEALSQVASVALFVQRAQAAKPGFHLTPDNTHIIAEICNRLDGLPLALELAAARIKLFTPHTLLKRLEHRFAFLTGGRKDVPARQQTLRDAITWSYDLLTGGEQAFLRRLAVFAGGCTLEAAEEVCMAPGDISAPTLDIVVSLLDQSLLQQREQETQGPRLHLMEIIREYGLEVLIGCGELERSRKAHADYYLDLAEEAEPAFVGALQATWLQRLERELENIRAAFYFLLDCGETAQALRLVSALQQFWMLGGYLNEGLSFLEQGLAAIHEGETAVSEQVQAKTYFAAGYLAFAQNDPEQATAFLKNGERLYRASGNKQGIAATLEYLSLIARNRGEMQAAAGMEEEGLQLAREVGDREVLLGILLARGTTMLLCGEYARAQTLLEECLSYAEEMGHIWGSATILQHLSWLAYSQGEYVRARPLAEQSIALFTTLGKPFLAVGARIRLAYILIALGEEKTAHYLLQEALALGRELESVDDIGHALYGLAHLALHKGEQVQARRLYEESIAQFQGRWLLPRNKWILASCLEGLAIIAFAQGNAAWTVRLYASSETVRGSRGCYSPLGREQSLYDRTLTSARKQLGEKTFTESWVEGLSMTPEQSLTTETGAFILAPYITTSPALPFQEKLTVREVEVLQLVAKGLTNHQIAERLALSPHTVNVHIQSIYGKLGVSTRVEATRYALEHHLL